MSSVQQPSEAVVLDEAREPQPVLSIRGTVASAQLSQVHGELWRTLRSQDLTPAGPPFVR